MRRIPSPARRKFVLKCASPANVQRRFNCYFPIGTKLDEPDRYGSVYSNEHPGITVVNRFRIFLINLLSVADSEFGNWLKNDSFSTTTAYVDFNNWIVSTQADINTRIEKAKENANHKFLSRASKASGNHSP